MFESGSRGGPSPTQFGNLNLEDVPRHVLVNILDPLQAPPKISQQQAAVDPQAKTGGVSHSEAVRPPRGGPQHAEQSGRTKQSVPRVQKNESESMQYKNVKPVSESRDELSSTKMAGGQIPGNPIEISYTLRNPGSMPKLNQMPVQGSSGITIDKGSAGHTQPAAAAADMILAVKDSCGGSSKSKSDKSEKMIMEGKGCQESDATKRGAEMHDVPVLGHTHVSRTTNSPDHRPPSTGPGASVEKPITGAQLNKNDALKPKPKVVSAIPSSSVSQPSKKASWVHVAAKRPIRVPYATHAAGTVMSQDRRIDPSSSLLGTSSSCKPSASEACGCNTGVPSSDPHAGASDKSDSYQNSNSYAAQGCANGQHNHQGSVGRGVQKQNGQKITANQSHSRLVSSYVLGQHPSPNHHQTYSEPNMSHHYRHTQSTSQVAGSHSVSLSVQEIDNLEISSSAHVSQSKRHQLYSHQKNDNGETGKDPRKSVGRMPPDKSCGIQHHDNKADQSKGFHSSRGAPLQKSRSIVAPDSSQHAQKDTHFEATMHSSSKAGTSNPYGLDRAPENFAARGADPLSQRCGTSSGSVDPVTSFGGLQGEIFTKPVKSEKIVNLVDFLCSTESMQPCRFWEQGITNLGNTCFLGSALQMLLGSGHFCAMLVRLGVLKEYFSPVRLPTLFALGELANKLGKRPDLHGKHNTGVSAVAPRRGWPPK